MWPNKVNDIVEDDEDQASATSADFKERGNWEMYGMKSPASAYASPFTPRTQAFHTLDRQLPLRQQHDVRRYA